MTDEVEKLPEQPPMPPPGFSLIPTESITRLQEASTTFKARPVIREIAEGEPQIASALEELGRAVTSVIAGPKPDEKRALGEERSPEEQQQGVLAIGALLGVGAVLMWAYNKQKQEEAEAQMAQQAAMAAAAAAAAQQQQQGQQYQRGG